MDNNQEIMNQRIAEIKKKHTVSNNVSTFLPKTMQKLNMTLHKLSQSKMNNILKGILGVLLIVVIQPIEMLMKMKNFILFSSRRRNIVPKRKGCGCGKK